MSENGKVAMDHDGLTLWFTGLSGAGKSTIAEAVERREAAVGQELEVGGLAVAEPELGHAAATRTRKST